MPQLLTEMSDFEQNAPKGRKLLRKLLAEMSDFVKD
jgi:hypothetical protein